MLEMDGIEVMGYIKYGLCNVEILIIVFIVYLLCGDWEWFIVFGMFDFLFKFVEKEDFLVCIVWNVCGVVYYVLFLIIG